MRRLVVVVFALQIITLGVVARTQQPAFRAAVDLVDVDVSVLDRNRLPVPALRASDFTVLEDGRPRPIVASDPVPTC
ncbi:MAG: hypothetical protein ABI051_10680 [Vicinamibacterales bacterium]